MARYTGPSCRICRRYGEKLYLKGDKCFTPKCPVEARHTPPGAHGAGRRRRVRVSEYAVQLKEKQKIRFMYGVFERQLEKYFAEAERRPGLTGENLFQTLETRLDNVAYRLGYTDSRKESRQLVLHGHVTVNGRKVGIPSFRVKVGDVVAWKEGSNKLLEFQKASEKIAGKTVPGWLSLDRESLTGRMLSVPARSDMELETTFDDRLIVAFYSR